MKRMHLHVGVDDLQAAIGFYSTLFAAEPSVIKPDYAKWMLEDSRISFAFRCGVAKRLVSTTSGILKASAP